MRYRREPLNKTKIIPRELDKGRGTRTTSKKTLSTQVPLVMCFDYKKVKKTVQNRRNQLGKKEE
jgi:hypothetical protein